MAGPSTPRFPLPRNYFEQQGPELTQAQQQRYCAIAQERIDAVLRAEHEFVVTQQQRVDSSEWKLSRKKKQVRIYRRRHSRSDGKKPDMLGVGRMDGTLEDLVYGTYDLSTEEMKTTMSFVDVFTKDCAVLQNLELATPDDPFHYVGLKWVLSQLPGKLFVKPRDWCYVEAIGINRDAQGRRYGYTIVHTVDVPNCPPFDPRSVVRGKGSLSFLYREVADAPGVIEMFALGLFEPAIDLVPYFSVIMTTEIFSGQALTVKCAEAKKLTLLALRNYRARSGSTREAVQRTCYMCVRRDGVFSSLKICNICGVTTCEKCRTKRLIFMGERHSVCEVSCCHSCIFDAKHLQVRPSEAAFSIHGRDNRLPSDLAPFANSNSAPRKISGVSANALSGKAPSVSSAATAAAALARHNSSSTDEVETASDDDQYSSMGETDFEKIIEAMIDERLQGTSRPAASRRTGSHQLDLGSASLPTSARSMSVASTAVVPAVEFAVPVSAPVLTPEQEQAALFQKMLELQMAASQVYKITKANEAIMKQLT